MNEHDEWAANIAHVDLHEPDYITGPRPKAADPDENVVSVCRLCGHLRWETP